MRLDKIISFYRECYKQEFRDSNILNFLGSKVKKPMYFDDIHELFQEEDDSYLDQDVAAEVSKYLLLNSKEKSLVCSSFFITGELKFLGRKRRVCAPLISTPVSINEDSEGLYFFKFNFEANRFNDTLLGLLRTNYNLSDDFLIELQPFKINKPLGEIELDAIVKKIKEYIAIDDMLLPELPKLFDGDTLRDISIKGLRIVPSVGICFVDKPSSSRGVLNELDEIVDSHMYNETLNHFFGRTKKKKENSFDKTYFGDIYVPANLSEPQMSIIGSSKVNKSTVVIGPPGTGKSYTIAALAIDKVYNKKSVLICAKTDQAVDVIQHKIVHDIGVRGVSVRVGEGRSYKSKLKKGLDSILRRTQYGANNLELSKRKAAVRKIDGLIEKIEKEIKRREAKELRQVKYFTQPFPNFFDNAIKRVITYKILQRVPLWELVRELERANKMRITLVKHLVAIKQGHEMTQQVFKYRSSYVDLREAISSKSIENRDSLFDSIDFKSVLTTLPVWITKSADISSFLPLKNDMFDVAIIDEASQCDMATMIPILARAKSVVVVGDPMQLRHVSFLSNKILDETAAKYGVEMDQDVVNYRTTSFLDFVLSKTSDQNEVHFLNEHYRSRHQIISFSNDKFYNADLNILSELKINRKDASNSWVKCTGNKEKSGINRVEADTIIENLRERILLEKELPANLCSTIGVISPFRDQVIYIKKMINTLDLSDLKKHKVYVGTPHEFQGVERDIIHISFTVDNNSSSTVLNYLNKEDVFNVTITRAKDKQYLYYSFDPKMYKPESLLVEYFTYCHGDKYYVSEDNLEDDFVLDVENELLTMGVSKKDIIKNRFIAGYLIDVILTHNNKVLCIDLVGFPGDVESIFPFEQYRALFRSKVPVLVIPYSYWVVDRMECLHQIRKRISLL